MASLQKAKLPDEQLTKKQVKVQVVYEKQPVMSELPEFVPVVHN